MGGRFLFLACQRNREEQSKLVKSVTEQESPGF